MLGNNATVIIPVYGDIDLWSSISEAAYESAINQTVAAHDVIIVLGETISECRNRGGTESKTEFIIFLDADDELHPNYIEEMLNGSGDIRVPSVHRHYENGHIDKDQHWYTPKDLMTGNYIVVSAMIQTSLFNQLGGFYDYKSLEDWDLWLRAEEAGATFEQVPNAILKVNKRFGSRNSNASFEQILNNAKERRNAK